MQVLIVDDEPYMVDYLRKLVDWEQYGFEHVYTAGGGSMARDMLDKYQPELLITDIRMPKISGLDLCRHIFEKKYPTKVMIYLDMVSLSMRNKPFSMVFLNIC